MGDRVLAWVCWRWQLALSSGDTLPPLSFCPPFPALPCTQLSPPCSQTPAHSSRAPVSLPLHPFCLGFALSLHPPEWLAPNVPCMPMYPCRPAAALQREGGREVSPCCLAGISGRLFHWLCSVLAGLFTSLKQRGTAPCTTHCCSTVSPHTGRKSTSPCPPTSRQGPISVPL